MPLMSRHLDNLVLLAADLLVRLRYWQILRRTAGYEPKSEHRRFHIARPRTANEKFLWRKIFDRDPRWVTLSDKLQCKGWITSLDLGLNAADVLWSGTDPALLPPAFLGGDVVVKANHGCGTNLFPARQSLGRDEVIRRTNVFLRSNHGRRMREWGYFNVPRCIFVEPVVGDGRPLSELKFYTFGTLVPRVVVIEDRFGDMAAARWEPDARGRPTRREGPTTVSDRVTQSPLPPSYVSALALAKTIGAHFDHLRVDLLTDGDRLWLGELTVYNLAGVFPDCGHLEDAPFSRAWDLRRSWFLRTRHSNPWLQLYASALQRVLDREAAPPVPISL